jgi:hypothetical protein
LKWIFIPTQWVLNKPLDGWWLDKIQYR